MDINSILPLLLKNKVGDSTSNVDGSNATPPTDTNTALMQSILSGKTDQSTLISALASSSGNPQLAQTLSMAQNMRSNNQKRNANGLKPIKPFVNNDIMGKLTKYFS